MSVCLPVSVLHVREDVSRESVAQHTDRYLAAGEEEDLNGAGVCFLN